MASEGQRCDIDIRVRYAETDAMGYLHHAQYFVYFEMGRTELLRQSGVSYREMEENQLFYVVAKLECKYKRPARYDDLLTLTTMCTRFTPVRVDHQYELSCDGRLLAVANSTLALVGTDGMPTRMPDALFERISG